MRPARALASLVLAATLASATAAVPASRRAAAPSEGSAEQAWEGLDQATAADLRVMVAGLGRLRIALEQASEEAPAELLESMRDLLRACEEWLPLKIELARSWQRCRQTGSLAAFDREWEPLRLRVSSLDQRYDKAHSRWRPLYEKEFERRMAILLSAGAAASRVKPTWASSLHEFNYVVSSINFRPSLGLEVGVRIRAELAGAIQRRRRTRESALVGTLAVAGFLVSLRLWRRRRSALAAALRGGAHAAPAPGALRMVGGSFQVLGELGRGGMGVVYEAVDLTLGRRVAIKQMRQELRQSPRELEMFLTEARLVAALKHPHIVEIHGVVREGAELYLVFEHVRGLPLSRCLERGPLPLDRIRELLGQVASALDYAHSRRVIHRDLKPGNIMVGEDRIAKVMDFGLAHQAKMTVARLTRAEACGTRAYMAPEQELGSVSRESDIYALGVCLYEMATGRLPYEGPNFLAQKRAARYEPPSRLGLPAVLDGVVARALQPEPAERFQSASELLSALGASAVP